MRNSRFAVAGLVALPLIGVGSVVPLVAQSRSPGIDYADIDRDRDGVITRAEWQDAFSAVDRNRDGVLSGSEVGRNSFGQDPSGRDAPRASRPTVSEQVLRDQFVSIDRSGDGIINRGEWKLSRDEFDSLDLNRNGELTRREYGIASTDGNRTIDVDARVDWVSTGLTVIKGDTIALTTDGSVQLSSDPNDLANPPGALSGRPAPQAPLPQVPAGALIGRIGVGQVAVFAVGDLRQIIAPSSGTLFLRVNDDHLADNSGRFRVRIALR